MMVSEIGGRGSGGVWLPERCTDERLMEEALKKRYDAMWAPTLFSIRTIVSVDGSKQNT